MKMRRYMPSAVLGLMALTIAATVSAEGLTIINTDSKAETEALPPTPRPQSNSESAQKSRGAPPLPSKGNSASGGSEVLGFENPNEGDDAAQKSEPQGALEKPEPSNPDEGDDAAQKSEPQGMVFQQDYSITEKWLSDAVTEIAEKAGYGTTVWTIGKDGERDFELHSDITLTAASAKTALGDLVAPYPIRLCLFNVDRVAKVVTADASCQ